jgi:hypothetical protein
MIANRYKSDIILIPHRIVLMAAMCQGGKNGNDEEKMDGNTL